LRNINSKGKHSVDASTTSLTQAGYKTIAGLQIDEQMAYFIQRVVRSIGGVIVDDASFQEFVPHYSGTIAVQSFNKLLADLRSAAAQEPYWVKLAPPNPGTVLWQMVRPEKWNCHMLPAGDARETTCLVRSNAAEFNPKHVTCGKKEGHPCSIEHANAFRANLLIGVLPCCSTPPNCAAPTCSEKIGNPGATSCTKREASENLAYIQRADAWPAYHGWSGSFDLDQLKFIDLIGCTDRVGGNCGTMPFDIVLDVGSNVGTLAERLTVRHFSKSYIMIDANPVVNDIAKTRWGNRTWRRRWFVNQVDMKAGAVDPSFEIVDAALSHEDGLIMNLCMTEPSLTDDPSGCSPTTTTVDAALENRLSSKFKKAVQKAKSMFVKIDAEGMDEMIIRGMKNLLNEVRGVHENGTPAYLVNFMQVEIAPALMDIAKQRDGMDAYDIKTMTQLLESLGFEAFLIGPRYIPLSNGSLTDEILSFLGESDNNANVRVNFPKFTSPVCPWCGSQETATFTGDVLAIRSSHPRAQEIKLALGACKESRDFDIQDKQYTF